MDPDLEPEGEPPKADPEVESEKDRESEPPGVDPEKPVESDSEGEEEAFDWSALPFKRDIVREATERLGLELNVKDSRSELLIRIEEHLASAPSED